MRKILLSLGVSLLAVGALTSCGSKGSKSYSAEDKAFGDSVATSMGEFLGAQNNQRFAQMLAAMPENERAKFDKADFIAGLKAVLEADTAKMAYYYGMQTGMQMVNQIVYANQSGFPVDPKTVLKAFKEAFMGDSIDDAKMQEYYGNFQSVQMQFQKRAEEKYMENLRSSDKYKETGEAGVAYGKKMVAEGYTVAPSGIIYKIENPGQGDKVKSTDKVAIRYKGKHIDGEVFDETKDEPYTSSAAVFVPGFNEALTMLAKGGKMTVVIPPALAYGDQGAGDVIQPNETLVFDIEIEDILPPTPKAENPAAAKLSAQGAVPSQIQGAVKK